MERALYVHIPFCEAKCWYCDFTSYPGRGEGEKETYLQALCKEAKYYGSLFPEEKFKSLYIGGGTPTCLSGRQLSLLFSFLHASFTFGDNMECTVEGNPGTINKEKILALLESGCNRLSLGVQSFLEDDLKRLGRIHTPQEVYNTYSLAREAGFANINLDLMYGLPGQSLAGWQENLRKVTALRPEHISLYQLHVEEGTPFYTMLWRGEIQEFDNELALAMYEEAIHFLTGAGYHHYEISNFALPGKESAHNQVYWRNEEYIGLGAGASGYLQGIRYRNHSALQEYVGAVDFGKKLRAEEEVIMEEMKRSETMFLGLRLLKGVEKERFLARHHITMEECFGNTLDKLVKRGYLVNTASHVALTRQGLYLANEVFQEFLP
jgi:oxygen-independent coproporphyrinogen-3 oxidase